MVGDETWLTIHDHKGNWNFLQPSSVERIRAHWENSNRMPDEISGAIADGLTPAAWDESGKLTASAS